VDTPASLPRRIYLLAYDTKKQKLTGGGRLGLVLRAAALTELFLAGQLVDDRGKPKPAGARVTDPLLDDIRREIGQSKPRSWARWTSRGERATFRAVQEQLADAGLIRVEPYRILGIFPASRVSALDTRPVHALRKRLAGALRAEVPVNRVEPMDAALVALATMGELRVAVSRAQARANKQRIAELVAVAGPAAPAPRRVIQERQAAAGG
jgi:hypothetical protein